jgi:glutamate-ammonia-ligase adenylyltransferase
LQAEICAALSRPQPAAAIRGDTAVMLAKVNAEIAPAGPWDVKYRTGGMMELAFIAEALQLIHGQSNPALFRANTAEALRGLQRAGHLCRQDGDILLAADFLWRTIQGIDRITGLRDQVFDPPPAMLAPLLRATRMQDLTELRAAMAQHGDDVHDCFKRLIAT